MTQPLLDPATEQKLVNVISNQPHALLLTGLAGIGKATVADWLATRILGLASIKQLNKYPYLLQIESVDNKAIGIESIRKIEHFTSLKVGKTASTNRIIIIYDAHLLTVEAQNALLKTLEEPPAGTMLLLTSSQQESLLPTIQSRLQSISIAKPSSQALTALLSVDQTRKKQIIALSGSLPGLAFALAEGDDSHPLVAAAVTARGLLQASTFEKLLLVEGLVKSKEANRNTTYMLQQMAHAALLTGRSPERWQKVLQAAYKAEESITNGAQPKLALTQLMLSL